MAVGIYTLISVGIVLFMYLVWLAITLAMAESQAADHILLKVIMKTGRPKSYWVKYKDQSVTLEDKHYAGAVKTWVIGDGNCIDSAYPDIPLIPNFLKRRVKEAPVYEWSAEPIINLSKDKEPTISPNLLGVMRMTGIASAIAGTIQDMMTAIQKLGKMLNPNHFYIAMAVIIVLIGWLIFQDRNMAAQITEQQKYIIDILKLVGGKVPEVTQ